MRKFSNRFNSLKIYGGIGVTVLCFFVILSHILLNGAFALRLSLFSLNSPDSLLPMIVTTLVMIVTTLLIALPIGIGCAVYLNEYAGQNLPAVSVIRLAVQTLSGIPSIIFGLFGFLFFVLKLRWSWSILAGVVTLSIMVLPLIIKATEEALKSVSDGLREGSFALGAGKFYTIRKVVLPGCLSGILSAVILAIGRIVGESAALILTAGTVVNMPNVFDNGFFSSAATLSVYMYTLTSESADFENAYATAIVLMILVLGMNILANLIAGGLNRRKT